MNMLSFAFTRVVNACVLLELPGATVLTDPVFEDRWYMRLGEPIGVEVTALPPLHAILGGHAVPDHWSPRSLRGCTQRSEVPVFVASAGMARSARRSGLPHAEVLPWGESREVGAGVRVTSLPGERVTGLTTNAYLIDDGKLSVLVATEGRDLGPLAAAAKGRRIAAVMLPVNGARLFGRRLVMDGPTAIKATRIVGARHLIPIHAAQRPLPGVLTCSTGFDHLPTADDITVHTARPGQRVTVEIEVAA